MKKLSIIGAAIAGIAAAVVSLLGDLNQRRMVEAAVAEERTKQRTDDETEEEES